MVNPADVQKSLNGISFPASRNQLICRAVDNGADMEIIGFLYGLPVQEYNSPTEISEFM